MIRYEEVDDDGKHIIQTSTEVQVPPGAERAVLDHGSCIVIPGSYSTQHDTTQTQLKDDGSQRAARAEPSDGGWSTGYDNCFGGSCLVNRLL